MTKAATAITMAVWPCITSTEELSSQFSTGATGSTAGSKNKHCVTYYWLIGA